MRIDTLDNFKRRNVWPERNQQLRIRKEKRSAFRISHEDEVALARVSPWFEALFRRCCRPTTIESFDLDKARDGADRPAGCGEVANYVYGQCRYP